MLSLRDTRNNPGIKRVLARCSNTQQAIDLINEGARRLMRRGDWLETVVPVFVCVYNGCVVMPRYVQQVRKMNVCNRAVSVHNNWFEFLAYNQNYCGWGQWLNGWLGQQCGMNAEGSTSVFQDVQGEGRTIRAYARCNEDYGKTMRIFGKDNNGQDLITQDPVTGTITQGALITLDTPFGSTASFVRSIDYVTRETTTCPVDVYAYNASTDLLEDVAHYQPSETTPTYARYKLNVSWPQTAQGCSTSAVQANCCTARRGVVIMAKLRFIDAATDDDLVLVPCVDALKLMIMAINREDAYDRQGARDLERDAIEVMNRELENNSPDDQFSAGVNTLGPDVWTNRCF
jgi:hypothetical protein